LAERRLRGAERARELRPLLPLAGEPLAQEGIGGRPGSHVGGQAIALRLRRRQRLAQPVALGGERLEARRERGHLRVALAARSRRPPQLVAQALDLGGRRRQRLLGRPRPLPRLVHGLLAVQALAPARRLELLAQALLARGGRPELADELGVPLLLLVELGADTRQSLLGLLGARAQALDLARPLRGARRRRRLVRGGRAARPRELRGRACRRAFGH